MDNLSYGHPGLNLKVPGYERFHCTILLYMMQQYPWQIAKQAYLS